MLQLKELKAVDSNKMEWEGTRFPECFIRFFRSATV